jgi:hypothetical protein
MVTLDGTVTQALSGLPLAATIELLGSPISATTGPDGYYTTAICPATYTLRASAPGYYPEERLVSLTESSTQDFSLVPLIAPLRTFLPLITR